MTKADNSHEFTEPEFTVMLAMCAGLTNEQIAEGYRITTGAVMNAMSSIFDKAGISTRAELHWFARAALNEELRRRKG
jgi:DNA-binding NarL/FixJ family response regulator